MISEYLSGLAVFITAVVGFFAYRANRTSSQNQSIVSGTDAAIKGLDILAQQHSKEIARLEANLANCLKDKEIFGQTIANLQGQIEILKKTAMGTGKAVQDTADSNARIETLLRDSANQTIDTQNVKKQVVVTRDKK